MYIIHARTGRQTDRERETHAPLVEPSLRPQGAEAPRTGALQPQKLCEQTKAAPPAVFRTRYEYSGY